jgi:hypothetical protein
MVDYTSAISQINNATSLEKISQIAEQFSAQASGSGGILYSGNVGTANADMVASQIANGEGLNILDATARGQFLSDSRVRDAIATAARNVFEAQGQLPADAAQLAVDFLNGNPAVTEGPTSVASSLWGQASIDPHSDASGLVIDARKRGFCRSSAQRRVDPERGRPEL